MKTSRLMLLIISAALLTLPARIVLADDTSAPATGSTSSPSGDKAARMEKFKAALAQLNLTDDQKAKVKDIFTNVPAGKERRQQIAAVLTPEQKEKLKQMIEERRGDGGVETPAAN